MAARNHSKSLFSQQLDRVAFVAYFLGAVVPLVALTVIVQRFVIPTLADTRVTMGIIAVVGFLTVLSFASFLILRRTTRQSITRMNADNARLQSLLKASSALAGARDQKDAAGTAALCAYGLVGGGAFVFLGDGGDEPPHLLEFAGKDAEKLLEKHGTPLRELAKLVIQEGRPAVRGAGSSPEMDLAAALVPVPGETGTMGVLAVLHPGVSDSFESATVDSLTTLASLTSVAFRNADLRDSQRNFFTHITDLVVTALDAHLGYHSGHSHRVAELANRIGRELGLEEDRMQQLHFAALLHDIGMLKLDRNMQRSPRACRKHAELGYRILSRIRLWQDLAPLVHYHHERWDGQGYPEGLLGDAIPVESRIIGFCEAFDTFANPNSYKVALSWEDALREVDACAGTQFDPQVVRAFQACVDRGDIDPTTFGSKASSSD